MGRIIAGRVIKQGLWRACIVASAAFSFLTACNNEPTYAPVTEISSIEPIVQRVQNKPLSPAPAAITPVASSWTWPARGKVILAQKGVNIMGSLGEPIYAAASGQVVYCGSGLRGYGNLIILKHNRQYLSAYAHNRVIFIKEGEWVRGGQKIAEMGKTGADQVMLYFEIRRAGKPIDPVSFIMKG
ncbi:MAG: hypothetical protein EPO11_04835 [Gammaproteobacteria bacterium]|nr:MAG: hypothetical protein EPO11_04835 [Gammaproteobacteria bacterium]